MRFEWDAAKSAANQAKHGVSFEEAAAVFENAETRTWVDDRMDYGEERRVSIGRLPGRDVVLVVAHTLRKGTIRLISARRANRRERKVHDDYLAQTREGN